MSFIYNLTDTWNNILTTYTSIKMNASNGVGGAAVGSSSSRLIDLQNNGLSVFSVDLLGNIISNGGALLNNITPITGTTTIDNSYNGQVVLCGGASFYNLAFNAAGTYTDGFKVYIWNGDTVRAKRISPTGLTSYRLWPQGFVVVGVKGGVFYSTVPPTYYIANGVTAYVNPAGSDLNDGMATGAANAFATLQQAAVTAPLGEMNFGKTNSYIVQLDDGTHTSGLHLPCQIPGQNGNAGIQIQGNAASPGNVVIAPPANSGCFELFNTAYIVVKNFKLQSSGNGLAMFSTTGATIRPRGGIIFDGANHMQCTYGGRIVYEGDYSINSSAGIHAQTIDGGSIEFQNPATINFTSDAAFTWFCYCERAAYQNWQNVTIALNGHTITGTRYFIAQNGVVNTNGGGANYFPGDVAGSTSTGGQYI